MADVQVLLILSQEVMPANSTTYKTIIITSIRQEPTCVKTFTLAYEDGSLIPYISGQFITVIFTMRGVEERRSYSISSSADLGEQLSFTVKRIDNGSYSRVLYDNIKVGDKLLTAGVGGLFTLPRHTENYQQVFFFAAGIGITPVFSLLKTLLHTSPSLKAVLIYSNRWQESVIFLDELNALAEKFPDRFKVEYLYSTAYNLERARLNKALIPVLMNEYAKVPKANMLFYVCGPYNYMRMVNLALEEQGIDGEQIRKENFRPFERPVIKAEPPDHRAHQVTLILHGVRHQFTCHYPESILESAKKHHIHLPFSCEVGRCGSCAATCTTGKVWMSYNEVLMDSDLEKGLILTCTGHPAAGDVTIEL